MVSKVQGLFGRRLGRYSPIVKRRAREALADDAAEDITTEALHLGGKARASIVSEGAGVVCGVLEAREILKGLKVKELIGEGGVVKKGQKILLIEGEISEILRRERSVLNYLQLLSGIATETRNLAEKAGAWKIAALRKNHPLLTISEKRAVQAGGGLAHRISLQDGYLVKNTHLEWLRRKKGMGAGDAVKYAVEHALKHRKKERISYFVEVEVMSLPEALAAAETGADAILIDNQKPPIFKKMADGIRKINRKIIIEASGGITPENAAKYLEAGADFVSMSHLVMRSKPLGMHLKLEF